MTEGNFLIPPARFSMDYVPDSDGPGIYFIFLKDGVRLGDFGIPENRLVYIGKSESSIKARNHAKYPTSSQSTLRRSIGAILRNMDGILSDLSVFPRATKKQITKESIQHYRFAEESEEVLSNWMQKNLTFSYERVSSDIRKKEAAYIKHWNPLLNIQNCSNHQKYKLENLREECRKVAKLGVADE